ncbi:paraquat-inducible protein A [Rhodobacteraceae bacterium]|nr:paraquat-inducible protein A [Paracoccaceae bacterium]
MIDPNHLDDLVACPHCDTLHHVANIEHDERAECARCGALLIASRGASFITVVALSVTAIILMVAAFFFPFLRISAQGFSNASSVVQVAAAFAHGWQSLLSIALVFMIMALPLFRFGALVYVLFPLSLGRKPPPRAATVFRYTENMQPWSMAEIFIIGTGVALVKVGGLATVYFGPAFWAFCLLIIVTAFKNSFINSWVIWDAIGKK